MATATDDTVALTPWPTDADGVRAATVRLRAALGLSANADAEADDIDLDLQRVAAGVSARIEEYSPNADQAARDEALVRAIAWLRDTSGAARERGVGPLSIEPAPVNSASWFLHSGAASLLTRWKVRRAGAI